ncbi:MAG: phosphodiester glycosidase family protein [Acidobacteriota bacterium]
MRDHLPTSHARVSSRAVASTLSAWLLMALVAPAPAFAQPAAGVEWRVVAPGVELAEFGRYADRTGAPAGPWSIRALRLDLAVVRLDVVHALDAAVGLETVGSIAARHGAIAAVNGGYFVTTGTFRGDSTGALQVDGALLSEPDRGRSAVGFLRDGTSTQLIFGRLAWEAQIEADGRTRPLDGLNRPRGANEIVWFTPDFHRTTLTAPGGIEVVVRGGRVSEVHDGRGSTRIPSEGFVVSAAGSARQWVRETLVPDRPIRVTWSLKPVDHTSSGRWSAAEDVVGAGPMLVTNGRVDITIARERMQPSFSTDRHPRTAIATLPDGRALLLVVDGRQPLRSIGMTLDELAHLLVELGAIQAMNLDGGGSSAMVVQGKVVNHPSDAAGERPVSDAILVRPRTSQ